MINGRQPGRTGFSPVETARKLIDVKGIVEGISAIDEYRRRTSER
ncbi:MULTISPECIES: hypothetical protein [Williamsia]|nr:MULTISPECIES: hypothetical protein [Williamsia]